MPAITNQVPATGTEQENNLFGELIRHYQDGFNETDKRRTGRGRIGSISFDEADELYRSWIDEKNWPYDALIFDPRIFTLITEKTSRLFANKLRGRLHPREGGDVMAAYINNELLNYQWDTANHGGSMLQKFALMDTHTRKYGASFALTKWHYEKRGDDVVFDGPEMRVLRNRDTAHDLSASSIEDCNWFQVREYVTLDDLQHVNDISQEKPTYKNLDRLKNAVRKEDKKTGGNAVSGGDSRSSNWISRNRVISGLTADPVGGDTAFPVVEIVTEYRKDKWITFAPRYGIILREIENPYENYEIPIVMLRYYAIDDDLYGISEIEPVKGPQKAINALISQYLDEINQSLYTPIAVGNGIRDHTFRWGKGQVWRMNDPYRDFRLVESRSNAAAYFNNTYSALVAAMMNAVGESSLGISNVGSYQTDKTATEVQALSAQRNARDSYNQQFLAEAIKRQMMLWHQMNQKMLFADPLRKNYIIRVVGQEAIKYFQTVGLNQDGISPEDALNVASEIENGNPSDLTAFTQPLNPVNLGSEEEPNIVSKFQLDEASHTGQLIVEPEDLKGSFDFIADVTSMSLGNDREEKQGRAVAITALLSNPNVLQMLSMSGTRPKFKDLFIQWLEDSGFKDAEKYFEQIPAQGQTMPGMPTPQAEQPGTPDQTGADAQGQLPPEIASMLEGFSGGQQESIPNVGQDINGLMNENVGRQL